MSENESINRRSFLKYSSIGVTVSIAGCIGDGPTLTNGSFRLTDDGHLDFIFTFDGDVEDLAREVDDALVFDGLEKVELGRADIDNWFDAYSISSEKLDEIKEVSDIEGLPDVSSLPDSHQNIEPPNVSQSNVIDGRIKSSEFSHELDENMDQWSVSVPEINYAGPVSEDCRTQIQLPDGQIHQFPNQYPDVTHTFEIFSLNDNLKGEMNLSEGWINIGGDHAFEIDEEDDLRVLLEELAKKDPQDDSLPDSVEEVTTLLPDYEAGLHPVIASNAGWWRAHKYPFSKFTVFQDYEDQLAETVESMEEMREAGVKAGLSIGGTADDVADVSTELIPIGIDAGLAAKGSRAAGNASSIFTLFDIYQKTSDFEDVVDNTGGLNELLPSPAKEEIGQTDWVEMTYIVRFISDVILPAVSENPEKYARHAHGFLSRFATILDLYAGEIRDVEGDDQEDADIKLSIGDYLESFGDYPNFGNSDEPPSLDITRVTNDDGFLLNTKEITGTGHHSINSFDRVPVEVEVQKFTDEELIEEIDVRADHPNIEVEDPTLRLNDVTDVVHVSVRPQLISNDDSPVETNIVVAGEVAATAEVSHPTMPSEQRFERFQFNDRASGYSSNVKGPTKTGAGVVRWRETNHGGVEATPVIRDGVVYTAYGDQIVAHNIYSGEIKWQTEVEHAVVSPLSIHGQHLLVGDEAANLTSLGLEDGRIDWTHSSDTSKLTAVVAGNNNYYIAAMGRGVGTLTTNRVIQINPETGAQNWQISFREAIDHNVAPSFEDGLIAVSSSDRVYIIDTDTQEIILNKSPRYSNQYPVIDDGVIYNAGWTTIWGPDGCIDAIDIDSGEIRWSGGPSSAAVSMPVVTDTHVYAATSSEVAQLNKSTGSITLSFNISDNITASPVVANDILYTGCSDGVIQAFNTDSGNEIWREELTAGIQTGVAVSDGLLAVGTSEGLVVID